MKIPGNNLMGIPVIIALIMLSGCAPASKVNKSNKRIKVNEIVVYQNNVIIDPISNYTWTLFEDNPTTYYRFKLSNSPEIGLLPSLDEISGLLEKISYQLDNKTSHGNVADCQWFKNDFDFLTSSSETTPEGEILYNVVHWNSASGTFSKSSVTGGDLVIILLLNKN